MDNKINLDRLIIFPNTIYPGIKADYIISARGIEARTNRRGQIITSYSHYVAYTDTRQVYDHFWNDALTNEDKVPAITHMLYQLKQEYGFDFGYLQPAKISINGKE